MYSLIENITMSADLSCLINPVVTVIILMFFVVEWMESLDKFSNQILDVYVKRTNDFKKKEIKLWLCQVFMVPKPFTKPLPVSEPRCFIGENVRKC